MPSLPITYRIYRDGNPTPVGSTTALNFTDVPLLPDSSHTYQVDAVDSVGNVSPKSGVSASISVVPSGDVTPPTVPGTPTGAATGPATTTISWAASTDASPPITYRVYRNTDGYTTPIGTTTSLSYNDFGLAPSTGYTYKVAAVDAALNVSAKSAASATITTDAPSVTPPTPTLRGFIEATAVQVAHVITPSSTPVGEVMLHISVTNGTSITPSVVVTGGGAAPSDVTWRMMRPVGNDVQAASSRKQFLVWGTGTFNGSAITVTFVEAVDCNIHLIDWANTKPGKPFTHVWFTPLPNGNFRQVTQYQQRRIGSNNALAVFVFNGTAQETHNITEGVAFGAFGGAILKHSNPAGLVCTTTSFWKASSFTDFQVTTDWNAGATASSGGFMYEVQATDSDNGPQSMLRRINAGGDPSGNVGTPSVPAYFPKPNEVVIFATISERPGSSVGFSNVTDSSSNAFSEAYRMNLDADHVFQVWSFRYGASPPAAPTIQGVWAAPGPVVGSVWALFGVLKEDGTGPPGTTNLDWIRQIVSNTAAGSTGISVAVPSPLTTGSILALFGKDNSAVDFTLEQGWVYATNRNNNEVVFGSGNESQCIFAAYLGGDEDPSASTTYATADAAAIGIEIL